MYTDVRTAWDYLTATRGIAATQIVIVGYSMGGGVAAWLTEQTHPAGLILVNTFTSLKDRGSELYPYLFVRQLMRYDYPILERLPQITSPILIAHARNDRTIRLSMATACTLLPHRRFRSWRQMAGTEPELPLYCGSIRTIYSPSLPPCCSSPTRGPVCRQWGIKPA